ncbi:hypothetical protein WG922_16785 [Ramlibacter sp. AN1015]|uniref:hypothetical protein n=1 Tax=Ramlibacter sp. AN1015 TaxID=3133428 RepID=UPI0030C0F6AD
MFHVPLTGALKAIDALKDSLTFNLSARRFVAGGGVLPPELPRSPPLDEWRRLDYSTTVTRLYQVYESLVHDCVSEWLADLCQLVPYPDLPDEVQVGYRNGIGYLLQNLDGRRYESLSASAIIREYHAALSGVRGYTLYPDAFLLHDRNLRVDELAAIFRGCGIKIQIAEWLKQHRISRHDSLVVLGHSSVDRCLVAFVELRNEASHATRRVSQVLGEELLIAYADFIRQLSEALVEALTLSSLKWHEEHGQWSRAGKITFVKTNERAVCVAPLESCRVDVGAEIYLVSQNSCRRAVIRELRVDEQPVQSHTVSATAQEVGLRVDIETFKNWIIYVNSVPPVVAKPALASDQIQLGADDTDQEQTDTSGGEVDEPDSNENLQ